MKNSLPLISLLLLLLVTGLVHDVRSASKASHHGEWGAHGSRDVLLHREILQVKGKPLLIASRDYEYRQTNDRVRRTITRIVATDQYTNGNGGFATITDGGPGFDYVKIHAKSQRGHGYNFIVDIFGQ